MAVRYSSSRSRANRIAVAWAGYTGHQPSVMQTVPTYPGGGCLYQIADGLMPSQAADAIETLLTSGVRANRIDREMVDSAMGVSS